MSKKYQNKYRIETTRLQNWNYGWSAAYFITICTKNRELFFGEIKDEKMYLSDIGNIVNSEWLKTPEIRPDMNLELDEFIVMPNHFHAIIIIGENEYNRGYGGGRYTMHRVSTDENTHPKNKFGSQSKNLASIIRGFKSSVTIQARKINPDYMWQSGFHDHIIRNKESFNRIKRYIRNNPANWNDDSFNKK